MVKYSVVAIWLQKLLEKKLRRMSGISHTYFFLPEWMSREAENENAEETGACRDYDDFFKRTRYTVPEGVLDDFIFHQIFFAVSVRFCYSIGVFSCPLCGVKNPHWHADT